MSEQEKLQEAAEKLMEELDEISNESIIDTFKRLFNN